MISSTTARITDQPQKHSSTSSSSSTDCRAISSTRDKKAVAPPGEGACVVVVNNRRKQDVDVGDNVVIVPIEGGEQREFFDGDRDDRGDDDGGGGEDDDDPDEMMEDEEEGGDDAADDDDEDDKIARDLFPDPLSLIDRDADLDAVLRAKSIGDAIQILCPNLPGLPSKARGKYQKRKTLTEEQKGNVLRAINRENARRTRKRKKMYVSFIDRALSALEEILNSPDITSPALAGTASDEQGGGATYNTSSGGGLSSSSSAHATKRQRGDNDDERSFSSATVSGVTDDAASALSSMMTGNVFHLRLPPPCDHSDGNYHLKKAIILQALLGGCSSVEREARITSIDGLDRENEHSNSTSKESKKKKVGTTNGRATPAAALAANETAGASSYPTGLIEARLRIFKDYLHMRHGLVSSVDTTTCSVLASTSSMVPTTTTVVVLAAGGSGSRVKDVGTSSTSSVEEMKILVDERPTSSSAGGAASVPCGDCKKKEPTEQVAQEKLSNDLLAVSTPEFLDFCERLLQVCTGDVRHVTPLPSYRDSGGKNLSIDHISQRYAEYECHGLLAIIEDSFKIKAFSESLLQAYLQTMILSKKRLLPPLVTELPSGGGVHTTATTNLGSGRIKEGGMGIAAEAATCRNSRTMASPSIHDSHHEDGTPGYHRQEDKDEESDTSSLWRWMVVIDISDDEAAATADGDKLSVHYLLKIVALPPGTMVPASATSAANGDKHRCASEKISQHTRGSGYNDSGVGKNEKRPDDLSIQNLGGDTSNATRTPDSGAGAVATTVGVSERQRNSSASILLPSSSLTPSPETAPNKKSLGAQQEQHLVTAVASSDYSAAGSMRNAEQVGSKSASQTMALPSGCITLLRLPITSTVTFTRGSWSSSDSGTYGRICCVEEHYDVMGLVQQKEKLYRGLKRGGDKKRLVFKNHHPEPLPLDFGEVSSKGGKVAECSLAHVRSERITRSRSAVFAEDGKEIGRADEEGPSRGDRGVSSIISSSPSAEQLL